MGALSITGIKPGSTNLELTAGSVKKTVPVTTRLSRNLVAYGPVGEAINGYTATVDQDGSLSLSGGDLTSSRGVAWPLDPTLFAPGVYRLTVTKPMPAGIYIGIWSASQRVVYVSGNSTGTNLTITREQIDTGLRFGVCTLAAGGLSFGPVTVKPMLAPGTSTLDWESPDMRNAVAGPLIQD